MQDGSRAIRVEVECEVDGRWLAEVPVLAGALAYGQSREEAVAKAEALALRILAERLRAWRADGRSSTAVRGRP